MTYGAKLQYYNKIRTFTLSRPSFYYFVGDFSYFKNFTIKYNMILFWCDCIYINTTLFLFSVFSEWSTLWQAQT